VTWHWLASASGQTDVALSRLSTPSMVNDFHDVERGSDVQKPPASAFRVETQTLAVTATLKRLRPCTRHGEPFGHHVTCIRTL
jgi:hypothetical protein